MTKTGMVTDRGSGADTLVGPPSSLSALPHRLFVVAYASRGDHRPDSRLGLFITTVRDGYQGGWRVLQATTQPYD